MPASLTKLEQAVKRAHTAYDKAEHAQRERQHAQVSPADTGDAPIDEELDEGLAEAA